jgi:hypothetical protein
MGDNLLKGIGSPLGRPKGAIPMERGNQAARFESCYGEG